MSHASETPKPSPEQIASDIATVLPGFNPEGMGAVAVRSSHGIWFGTTPDHGDVAVKLYGKPGRAKYEERNLLEVARRGIDAVQPLQVATGGLATYLVTRRVRNLHTMGDVWWQVGDGDPNLPEVIEPALEKAAFALAQFHGEQIVHGDWQPRNVWEVADKGPVFGDAERTWTQLPRDKRTQMANTDLMWFGGKALAMGLLQGSSPQARAEYLGVRFVDAYLDAIACGADRVFPVDPSVRREMIVAHYTDRARQIEIRQTERAMLPPTPRAPVE